MDTSTPVRNTKSTSCRNASIQPMIAEDGDFSSPSVVVDSPSCYSPNEPEVALSRKCETANLDRSTELFPFSPISCPRNVPQTLLPLLDTPNLKWSTSILTPYGLQPQNELSMQSEELRLLPDDSDSKLESAVYTTSSFPIFDDAKPADSSAEIDLQKPINQVLNELVSPVLRFNPKSKAKKCSKTVKKLFSIPEDDVVNNEVSYQRMSDLTMDALEQICQISETLYSNSPAVSSEAEPSSSSTDPVPSKQTSRIGSPTKPSSMDEVNASELDFVFNTSFDLDENCKSTNLFENSKSRNSFVYPFDVVKKPECAVVIDDVIKSVLPLEQCDRVCVTKRKPVPRAMIPFSQLNLELENSEEFFPQIISVSQLNLESDVANELCSSTLSDNSDANFDMCTFWNYQSRPVTYSYLTRVMRKHRSIYFSLKSFFEICRIDFARVVSEMRSSPNPLGVSSIVSSSVSLLDVPPYLTNRKANTRLNGELRLLRKTTRIRVVEEFFEFFRCHFELLYNQGHLMNFSVTAPLLDRKKRKRNSRNVFQNESRRKFSNKTVNQHIQEIVSVDVSYQTVNSLIQLPTKSRTATDLPDTSAEYGNSDSTNVSSVEVSSPSSLYETSSSSRYEINNGKINNQIGFRTANGKRVAIKPQSLADAQKLFTEVKEACDTHRLHVICQLHDDQNPVGFSTASGKRVIVSDKSLTNAKKMLDLASVEVENSLHTQSTGDTPPRKEERNLLAARCESYPSIGTQLNHAEPRSSIQEPHGQQETSARPAAAFDGKSIPVGEKIEFASFTTASGKCVNVEAESLVLASKLLEDIEISDFEIEATSGTSESFHRFNKVADNNIERDKEESTDVDTSNGNVPGGMTTVADLALPQSGGKPLAGFSLVSGKLVQVKEESLARARALLMNVSEDVDLELESISETVGITNGRLLTQLNTAAGRRVDVGGQSLIHAESLFNAVSENIREELPLSNSTKLKHDMAETNGLGNGFRIATCKPVDVKGEPVIQAKSPLRSVLDDKTLGESVVPNSRKASPSSPARNPFPGFSTAAGKQVRVKEQSLARAESLLNSVSEDLLHSESLPLVSAMPPCNKSAFSKPLVRFNTAAGKPVDVKQQSLAHAETLLKSVSEETDLESMFSKSTNHLPGPSISEKFAGMASASGKRLYVNEQSLANTESLLKDVTKDTHCCSKPLLNSTDTDCSTFKNKHFAGFSTASGKQVVVKEESLARAETLLKNAEEGIDLQPKCVSPELSLNTCSVTASHGKLAGFSTASGKHLKVTEQSLARAESILKSISEEATVTEHPLREARTPSSVSDVGGQFARFSTAAGKQIDLKKQSLARAESLLNSISEECLNSVEMSCRSSTVSGFSTAAGRPVEIQEQSLARAESLLERFLDVDVPELALPGPAKTTCNSSDKKRQFAGFSTASGKTVSVKEQSLFHAESLLRSAEEDIQPELRIDSLGIASIASEESSAKKFSQVNTTTGKQVKVRDQSTVLAQSLLKPISGELDLQSEPQLCSSAESIGSNINKIDVGFSTAAGKRVNVKEQSLVHAVFLLNNVSEDVQLHLEQQPQNSVNLPGQEYAIDKQSAALNFVACQRIEIQEQPLAQAEALLKNAAEEADLYVEPVFPDVENRHVVGFTSAAGRRINVKEQSLARATELMNSAADSSDLLPESKKSNIADLACSVTNDGMIRPNLKPVNQCTDEPVAQDVQLTKRRTQKEMRYEEDELEEELSNLDVDQFFASEFSILDGNSKSRQFVQEMNSASALLEGTSDEASLHAEVRKYCEKVSDVEECKERSDGRESDILREVSGSTAAFMLDRKSEMSFQPVIDEASPLCFDSADETSKPAQAERSKPSSPIFETNKGGRQKRLKKRRSQSSALSLSLTPLNVTYGRRENDSLASDKHSPEDLLKKFKDNFAQKSTKRKEASSSMVSSLSKRIKEDAAEIRKRAVVEQQKYIANKCKEDCKPRDGWYMSRKQNEKRMSLNEAVQGVRPGRFAADKLAQLGLRPSVVAITSENAGNFVFTSEMLGFKKELSSEIHCGDECTVILNEKNEVRFEDLARAFLASPGVDPKLITEAWIRNHYRWIVWKLASMEKSYPRVFGGKYLTMDNVLYQLKFRYDREVDRCERSALKRIFECDDSASKPMVLCVAAVKPISDSLDYEIELTDGWYSIQCQMDVEMNKLITRKKVAVGTKLIVLNAELVGLSEGCDPLQVSSNVRLKIATNSTRRVRWDSRLGFYNHCIVPVIRDLKNVLPNGGMIFQLSAAIARIYPLLYMEKKDSGYSELYNEKVEFRKAAEYEQRRQSCLETLASQVTREVQRESRISDGEEWYINRKGSSDSDSDPVALQAQRYGEREKMRYLIQEEVEKKLPDEFRKRRQVLCMLKARLVNEENEIPTFSALITIWHPSEDIISLLAEGKVFTFHNVNVGDIRNGELRLSTSRMTRYEVQSSLQKPAVHQRRFTPIGELKNEFLCTFGEVDTVGVVLDAENAGKQDAHHQHTVYLADLAMNIVAVKFRSNLKDSGFEDTLKRQRIVAGMNLQWKRGSLCWKIPVTFATEYSVFVHKSRHKHLQCCLDEFYNFFKDQCLESFVAECEKKLIEIIRSPSPMATSTPVKVSGRNQVVTPVATSKVRSGLSATVPAADGPDHSFDLSNNLNRSANSKCVQSRIEKLRGYGEPPPLSPITMTVPPKRAKLSIQTRVFKSNEKT